MKIPNRADEFVSTIEHNGFRNKMHDKIVERLKEKQKQEETEKNEIPL